MMECIMESKKSSRSLLWSALGTVLIIAIWQLATFFFPPLVLPTPLMVLRAIGQIFSKSDTASIILTTVLRLICGLLLGIAIGGVLGLLSGLSSAVRSLLSPVMSLLQSVPPVCWVVLALVWFGFNGKPCVFIVALSTIPAVAINLSHGVLGIDKGLMEMARLYGFSRAVTMREVILPSIRPYLVSALEIVVGSGWKLAVMGEVLTTSSGIGGEITKARLNIEPDLIIAWSILLTIASYLTSRVLMVLFHRRKRC